MTLKGHQLIEEQVIMTVFKRIKIFKKIKEKLFFFITLYKSTKYLKEMLTF